MPACPLSPFSGVGHYNDGIALERRALQHASEGCRMLKSKRPSLPPTSPAGLIELRGVTKTYQSDAGPCQALKGVDLEVCSGEFVAVVGKSGSGKSTLINLITGIDRATAGELWVAGTPIHTLTEDGLAVWRGRAVGVVFQFFQLLPTLTVVENVMLPMDLSNSFRASEREERAMELLEAVDI